MHITVKTDTHYSEQVNLIAQQVLKIHLFIKKQFLQLTNFALLKILH